MAQEQTRKPAPQKTEETASVCPKQADKKESDEKTEKLLDEIDSILEEDAETFVKNFVQRGGE